MSPSFFATSNDENYASDSHLYRPVQRIAIELWSEIFSYLLSPSTTDDCPPGEALGDSRNTPIILASVCRVWRSVACSMKELWATCWVNFQHPELNTTWLQRAGASMLHLHGKPYKQLGHEYEWEPFFSSILPFQQRWRSLQLDIPPRGIMKSDVPFDCPALEILKVSRHGGLAEWMYYLLPNSPKLHKMEMETIWFGKDLDLTDAYMRFYSLSTLTLTGTIGPEVNRAVGCLPQLQHLTVSFVEAGDLRGYPTIKQTSLISFEIKGKIAMSSMLDRLKLPSLRKFRMQHLFDPDAFLGFVHRSGCHIAELRIGNPQISSDNLVRVLRDPFVGRWIEKLELHTYEYCLAPSLLNFLRHGRTNQSLPHLVQFSIYSVGFRDIPEGLVADLVMSLCDPLFCQCEGCHNEWPKKEIRMESVALGHLDRITHQLDVARLIPLPGDQKFNKKDTILAIKLALLERNSPVAHPVNILLGKLSSFRLDDGLDDEF